MNLKYHRRDSLLIVYDADCLTQPAETLFDPRYWEREGLVTGVAAGRGNALMLNAGFGAAVLRTYRRGGWIAAISSNRYCFAGYARSRPVAEMKMLALIAERGLHGPRPIAAACRRAGWTYTGALITRRISGARTLFDELPRASPESPVWKEVGRCIRAFHDAGVVHADLNARNVLVAGESEVYLVDFDRARLGKPGGLGCRSNLRRLRRSLLKLWPSKAPWTLEACWGRLIDGYAAGSSRS